MLTHRKNRGRGQRCFRATCLVSLNECDAFRRDHHMTSKTIFGLVSAAAISLGLATGAWAADTVKVGGIFPMSGQAASTGAHVKAAIDVVTDIVNNAHPELGNFPPRQERGPRRAWRRQGRSRVRR